MTDHHAAGGADRLRALFGKLRHPLVEVRRRAISNIDGKLSLGLMIPDELESDPALFAGVVALLSELAASWSSGRAPTSSEDVSGPLLSLCTRLAKAPSCKARLAGQGAHVPLSKIASAPELPRELRALAAEALALVEESPYAEAEAAAVIPNSENRNPRTEDFGLAPLPTSDAAAEDVTSVDAEGEGAGEALAVTEACFLDGVGSGTRWPRWTKDLVDGPSLQAKDASAETLVASLRAGWRFPPVRLIRSEESALFDLEVRFRTANTEASLLGCVELLRDEIMEDYPSEVLLQRPGIIGRLAALLRTPSASERILEEALSTAKRLLERLVYSARMHLDDAFLPPRNSETGTLSASEGVIINEHEGAADDFNHLGGTNLSVHGLFGEEALLRRGTGRHGPGPAEAAVATLLSFRYPQSSIKWSLASQEEDDAALGALPEKGLTRGRRRGNGPRDDAGSGDGLSFCGALFALFLSACPLLGCGVSPSGGGNGSDVVGPGTGGMDGSALGGDRSHAVPVVGARGGGDLPAVVPSKVALSTAELLQAMAPLLLEPLLTAQLASSAPPFPSTSGVDPPHGGGGGWKMTGAEAPRVSRLVDAFRMQELLCSLGRVLGDSIGARSAAQHVRVRGAGGNLGNQGRTLEDHGLRASAVPHPARSVALRLLLVITPSDLTGDCDDPLSLTLPSEYVSLVRAVAMDPVLAEEQPWLRERLRSYLSVADPEEAALLEEAQLLTRDAESVLEVDAGAVVDTDKRGPGDAWEWAAEQLRKVRRALPLARAVDEPRIVGAALTLWSAAAAATVNAGSFPDSRSMAAASGGPRSLDPHRPGQERAAAAAAAVEQLGAAILLDLVRGAFGERACCQTLCMLDEVVGVETAIGKGGVAVPSGLAEAMVSRGLPDPRQLSPSATSRRRSVAALTVFAGALTSPHNSDGSSDGRRGKKRNERERRVTSYGCVSSGMVRSTRSLSPSPSQSPPSASASATALMAALLQRAASAAPGKVTRDEEVANPVSLTSSPGQSSAAYYGGSGTVVGDGSDGGSSSGSDAHGNAVADGVAASASVSARRIVGWSCAELHTLLLSAREEATDGVDISRRWRRGGRSNGLRDGAENRAVVRDISAATAGVAATAAFRLAPTLEAFLCCCGERIAEENRRQRAPVRLDSAENFRELSRVVSSLLEFLDAFWCPTGMAWGSVMRGAEDVCVSPHVSKMLREVRGLCRGRAEDRASASRGLMGLLLEAPGGRERTNTPLVYTEDPLLLTQDDADFPWGQGSMARRHPAADPSIGAGVSNGRFALPSGSGSKPSFTADHVRNLAKVAASETLEPGLRRAAAEQLGAVLESPGVNAAVVSEDGCREKEAPLENLCAAVLRSALSGLLGPSYRKVNVPPPSLDTSLTSSHTNTSAPANASTAGSAEWPATADFRHDHRWEEAFLGLLRSAVWKLPSARLALLTPSPPPATHDADASTTASASSEVEAEVSVAVAVAAVLRRLYHPRPSVRRLASRVAIRMAFDPAVMFSPLLAASSPSMRGVPACSGCGEGVGTSERLQVETVAEGAWTRNCSGHARDGESRGAVARGSTDRWGPSVDGFRVPPMVLRAYPRLGEWATICSRRGDLDGCRDVSTLETSMLTVEAEQGGGNASRCDGRRDGRIRNCSDWYCGLGSRPDHCGGVIALASAEWQVLRRRQHRRKRPGEGQGEGGGESSSPRGDAAAPEAVANRLAEALRGASRRSQFLSAMAGARAWMLAGENYSEAFFGRGAVWRSAFERFLHTPPRSVKDRVALRNVLIFLKAGTAWMCPRGLDVLATMAEECFVPIMSEEWRPSVLENLSGDWKPPSRGESPKELEAKHRLQETVLELLAAVIGSPRLGTEAAQSLAVSSLPKVLWKKVLEENGGGNSWGQAEGRGKGSARLRRLAVTFLTGIVRRCEAFATSAWASVVTQGPKTSNDGFGFGGGNGEGEGVGWVLGQASKASTKGSGDGQDLSPSVLLTELIESLVRRASGHHSPDGFRGRASLTASLVALQTILATAAATIPAEVAATGTSEEAGPLWNPTRCSRDFDRVVALLLRGNGLNGGRRGDATGRTSRETGTVIRTRTALPSAPDATNSLAHGESQTQRLAWLLGLSCHRDSAVRALAFSVLAEIPPRVAAPRPLRTTRRVEDDLAGVMRAGFAGEEAGEVVHACLRAALDGIHESPAVVTEALRFLSRHTLAFSSPTLPGAQGAPQQGGYSLPLSASLGQVAATLLLEPVRGGNRCLCCSCCFCCSTFRGSGGARGRGKKGAAGGSAAGPLALAAAQLRFVATAAAAAAAATASAATVGSGGVSRDGARGPLWREGRAEEEEEEKSTTAEGGGCGVAGEFVVLVEACWASGCLESCVHVLGEAPGPVGCSGQPVNGERTCQCNGGGGGSGSVGGGRDGPWGQLLAASVEEEASALRRAQADALTLLRFVCRATTLCETSALTPPPPSSRRHSSDSPSSPAIPPGNTFGDRGINTAYAKGTSENPGEGGGHDTPGVQAAAEASAAVRRVLLTKTPLLAGVVRCFMGVVASGSTALSWVAGSSAASEMARVVDPERARRELSGAARVAREACASLRCILSVDAFHAMGTPPQQQQQQQQQRGGGAYPDLGPRKGWPRIEHPYAVHGGAPVTLASDLLSPGSAVPHAVLTAVGDVLRWPDGPEDARGREVAGLIVQAKTEARRLLPVMLSIPRWRNSLDLSSVEARSLAIVLFEEEVAALSGRGGSSWSERRTARTDGDLRARCLVPLLESSEYLQDLALSSGLIGDLYLALENSLAEIATVGHGRDAIKNAAIHLETLKAGMRRRRRSSPSIPGAAAAPAGGGASATPPGSTRQRKTKTKPPIPIEVKRSSRSPSLKTPPTKLTSNVSSKAAEEKAEATGAGVRKLGDDRPGGSGDEVDHHDGDNENHNNGGGRTGARTPRVSPGPGARPRLRPRPKQRPPPPPASLPSASSALAPSSDRRVGVGGDTKGGGAYRFRGRDSAAVAGKDATSGGFIPAGASGAGAGGSSEVTPAGWKTASRVGATAKAVVGEGPEEERGKALEWELYMTAALISSVVGDFPEGQAEALRVQLPQLLWKAWPVALASQLSSNSSNRSENPGGARGGGLLLPALLGMAAALAKGFPPGKRAFIFAGPEGANGSAEAGEWPRSSRSLLHRIAALALAGSPVGVGSNGEPEYGRAACEAACDVVRSCALSPECRSLLAQSGFFADAVAQIRRLCGKAGTRASSGTFMRAVGRVGDLTGVLVNASLRTEGQNALLQVDGIGDMLGDLLRLCLRAAAAGYPGSPGEASPVREPSGEGSRARHWTPPAIARALLLLRNLALAPSTGEVAAHRQPLLNLALQAVAHSDLELSRAAASCLRAVLRGGYSDGGGKTAVGIGARKAEVATAVESRLRAVSSFSPTASEDGGIEVDARDARQLLRSELEAVKDFFS